ncbi:MAG: AMP-binding protein, partial [Dehalococcoidia bacterium]
MVINLFKPRDEVDVGEAFLKTSQTPLTIPAMLADARARMGERVVYQHKLQSEWQRLTLDETWEQANEFAAGLVALGLQKGDRVAIICENGLPWAVGALGLFLAGGVTVPLYTELKTNEIEELVKRAGARMVIATSRVIERLGDHLSAEQVIVVGAAEAKQG